MEIRRRLLEDRLADVVIFVGLDFFYRRGIAENLAQEELVIVDLFTKPEIDLTKQDRAEFKTVARGLVEKLKQGEAALG